MCGLLYSDISSIDIKQFNFALSEMSHRGPDAMCSQNMNSHLKLGHCRLSIQDLDSRSNQPFISGDKTHIIIFNGEIYNFRELAKKYKIQMRTSSDTELVIELFLKLGPKMLDEFIGMFAFVIVDLRDNSIFVARDRLGVKPLYRFASSNGIIYSSEIAPIVKLIPSLQWDDDAVEQYLGLRGFFNGRTAYKNIEMFPAGVYEYQGKRAKYWSLPNIQQQAPTDEELEELLISAVNYRLISDVQAGSFLSGGVDSTIISALAKVTHTWTAGMNENNEFEEANLSADFLGTTHKNMEIGSNEFIDLAKYMINIRKEPLSVPNEVLLYGLSREAKSVNSVLLSGEGADELFYGYSRIFSWADSVDVFDIKKFTDYYAYGKNIRLELVEDALQPFINRKSPFDIVSAFFQISHLHGLLRRVDNSTMLAGVEARVPFVDHRLVERMNGVSFKSQNENGISKSQLRRVASRYLPEEISIRPKVGFPVPLNKIAFEQNSSKNKTSLADYENWLHFNMEILGYGK